MRTNGQLQPVAVVRQNYKHVIVLSKAKDTTMFTFVPRDWCVGKPTDSNTRPWSPIIDCVPSQTSAYATWLNNDCTWTYLAFCKALMAASGLRKPVLFTFATEPSVVMIFGPR